MEKFDGLLQQLQEETQKVIDVLSKETNADVSKYLNEVNEALKNKDIDKLNRISNGNFSEE